MATVSGGKGAERKRLKETESRSPVSWITNHGLSGAHDRTPTAPGADRPSAAVTPSRAAVAASATSIATNERMSGQGTRVDPPPREGTFRPRLTTTDHTTMQDPSLQSAATSFDPSSEYDEPELVRRAQLGSAAAFEKLVLVRGPQLHRFLGTRLRDDADALDALQETLTAAWQGLPTLSATAKFWPWICGIAAHKAADVARRRTASDVRSVDVHVREQDDDLLDIRDALSGLPEHFREVLLLRYVVGLSEVEVAAALGIRVGTVKSRSARARRALAEAWR